MTTDLIMATIPVRMRDFGYGVAYRQKLRSLRVPASGELILNAWNQWIYFPREYLDRVYGVEIESDVGFLRSGTSTFPEQQFEHTGKVIIRNPYSQPVHVTFIQVTPFCNSCKLEIKS